MRHVNNSMAYPTYPIIMIFTSDDISSITGEIFTFNYSFTFYISSVFNVRIEYQTLVTTPVINIGTDRPAIHFRNNMWQLKPKIKT